MSAPKRNYQKSPYITRAQQYLAERHLEWERLCGTDFYATAKLAARDAYQGKAHLYLTRSSLNPVYPIRASYDDEALAQKRRMQGGVVKIGAISRSLPA